MPEENSVAPAQSSSEAQVRREKLRTMQQGGETPLRSPATL